MNVSATVQSVSADVKPIFSGGVEWRRPPRSP
jgi:hypothetical protein